MAQVRNISPNALLVGDRVVGIDELLDVPDADFLDRAWPTSTWALVKPPTSGRDISPSDATVWTSAAPEVPAPTSKPAPKPSTSESE